MVVNLPVIIGIRLIVMVIRTVMEIITMILGIGAVRMGTAIVEGLAVGVLA